MQVFAGPEGQQLGIEAINPAQLTPEDLTIHARQLGHLVADLQQWYLTFPGAVRIDTSPPPDPTNKDDRNWRIGRLLASGDMQDKGLLYVPVYKLGPNQEPLPDDDAMAGLVLLGRQDSEQCVNGLHASAWILEFYLRKEYRNQGIGKKLLQEVAIHTHPADRVYADVAVPNTDAQDMYRHRLGFWRDQKAGILQHGVFNFGHIRMFVSGQRFRQKLGQVA